MLSLSQTQKGYVLASLMTFIFCCHYLVAKEVLKSVDVLALGAVRGLGGGLLLLCCFYSQIRQYFNKVVLLKSASIALFMFALNQVLFLFGLKLSTPVDAAVISNLIPMGSVFFAVLFGLEKSTPKKVAGLVLGFAAVSLYFYYLLAFDLTLHFKGNALIFANVISLCFGLALVKKWGSEIPHHVLTTLMLLFGGGYLFVPSLTKIPEVFSYAAQTWFSFGLIFFEVVISTAVAYLANMIALRYLDLSKVMSFAYFQPVVTGLLAWMAYGALPSLAIVPLFIGVFFANSLIQSE